MIEEKSKLLEKILTEPINLLSELKDIKNFESVTDQDRLK